MAFTLIQRSGKYQSAALGAVTQTYSAGLANFGAGRLLVSPFVHYSSVANQGISSVAYNTSDSATARVTRQNPTNTVNQAHIFDRTSVATTSAHDTALTFSAAGSPDGHFVTGNTTEWSYSDELEVVGTATNDGLSGAPSVTTPAGTAIGDLIVACFVLADGANFTVTTSPSGYTVEWTEGTVASFESGEGVSRIASVGGAQAVTWAISNSQNWSAVVSVYRDTSSGTDTTAPAPTVPGVFNRSLPPFWPPSDLGSFTNPAQQSIAGGLIVTMYDDRVKETTSTIGTGDITTGGAYTGFVTFNMAFGVGPQFNYCIESGSEWEVGRGHLSASATLVRDQVERSSNANALVNFSAGTKNVFCTYSGRAARLAYVESAINASQQLR